MNWSDTEAGPIGPFAALIPLVAALVAAGNEAVDGAFLNSPGGWYCRMASPIDFGLLGALELPGTIELSPEHDTVLDRSTWSAVLGPLSAGY
jgi:hypothetical protein